ncbi:hypothetical protein J2X76_002231 [Neorhizobium sp. 2083]|nr:hypothetical protein [Neorhizobium sp. 2083]
MENPVALNRRSENTVFRKGDVFVLFGELFGRGYATGLLEEARRVGMEIVGITVGRCDENNALRPLDAEELSSAEAQLHVRDPGRLVVAAEVMCSGGSMGGTGDPQHSPCKIWIEMSAANARH